MSKQGNCSPTNQTEANLQSSRDKVSSPAPLKSSLSSIRSTTESLSLLQNPNADNLSAFRPKSQSIPLSSSQQNCQNQTQQQPQSVQIHQSNQDAVNQNSTNYFQLYHNLLFTQPDTPQLHQANSQLRQSSANTVKVGVGINTQPQDVEKDKQIKEFHLENPPHKDSDTPALTEKQQQDQLNNNSLLKKTRTCNCKKTKCLKLYCDCFAVGELCGPDCKCQACYNNSVHSDARTETIEQILVKNPNAFDSKVLSDKRSKKNNQKKGCNCRRSGCLKKYCCCYNDGQKCDEHCKCTECRNIPFTNNKKKIFTNEYGINLPNQGCIQQKLQPPQRSEAISSSLEEQQPPPQYRNQQQHSQEMGGRYQGINQYSQQPQQILIQPQFICNNYPYENPQLQATHFYRMHDSVLQNSMFAKQQERNYDFSKIYSNISQKYNLQYV